MINKKNSFTQNSPNNFNISSNTSHKYNLPDCYIYFYHTDEYFILPQFPDSIIDSLESSFNSQNALARTAPVYSYNNSGPRTIQVNLKLHRDMMNDMNKLNGRIRANNGNDIIYDIDDDYIDLLVKKLQSIALPRYQTSDKLVNPPIVAIRFSDQVFIKGVVASGGVNLTYELPLLANKKYAQVSVSFTVAEIQPYDADTVGRLGSLRGLTTSIEKKIQEAIKR